VAGACPIFSQAQLRVRRWHIRQSARGKVNSIRTIRRSPRDQCSRMASVRGDRAGMRSRGSEETGSRPRGWPGLGRLRPSVLAADRSACAGRARGASPSLERQNELARGTVDGAGHRSANEGLAIGEEWRCFRMRRVAARGQTRPLPSPDQGHLGRSGRREAGTTMTEGAGLGFGLGSGSIACL
jgi:hypothetical protein